MSEKNKNIEINTNVEKRDNNVVQNPNGVFIGKTQKLPRENNKQLTENTNNLMKQIKKKAYTKIPKKLPLKAAMIQEYYNLCEEKGKEPEYTKAKLASKINKTVIFDLINELKGGNQDDSKPKENKSIMGDIKITKNLKNSAAEFIFRVEHMVVGGIETYLERNPGFGLNLQGLSYEMQQGKKDIKRDLYEIVECYPWLTTYLNPILTHSVKMVDSGLAQHKHNTNSPRPILSLDTGNNKGSSRGVRKSKPLIMARNNVPKARSKNDTMPLLVNLGHVPK